jgi:type IV secretion system protein TrbL
MSLIDSILEALLAVFTLGMSNLQPEVQWLMRVFIGIEIVTAAAFWFFAQESVVTLLSFKVVRIGLFALFVLQWPVLVGLFLDTMIWVGTSFSGDALTITQFRTPSTYFSAGFRATDPIFQWVRNVVAGGWQSVINNLHTIALYLIAALGIWAAFMLIALHMLVALVLFWTNSAFLLIFIPFGVWTGTSFLAERAMGGVISGAVRLGMLAMILGITFPLTQTWVLPAPTIGVDPNLRQAYILMGASVGVFLLSWIAPAMGAALFEGGPVLSGQSLVTGIGSGATSLAGGGSRVVTGAADLAIRGTSKLANSSRGEKHG